MRKVITDIEGLDALDGASRSAAGWVGRATRSTVVRNALSGSWLVHQLHPMLTDLSIGAWTTASVLDLTAVRPSAAEDALAGGTR